MADLDRLLRAILDEPADDLLRCAYSDALEETGDLPRAAFIRRQLASKCASLRLTWLVPFEDFLGAQPHLCLRWSISPTAHVISPTGNQVHWERGLVCRVHCPGADWCRCADSLLAAAPITEVELTTLPETRSTRSGKHHTGRHRVRLLHHRWHDADGLTGWHPRLAELLLAAEWPRIKFRLPLAAAGG